MKRWVSVSDILELLNSSIWGRDWLSSQVLNGKNKSVGFNQRIWYTVYSTVYSYDNSFIYCCFLYDLLWQKLYLLLTFDRCTRSDSHISIRKAVHEPHPNVPVNISSDSHGYAWYAQQKLDEWIGKFAAGGSRCLCIDLSDVSAMWWVNKWFLGSGNSPKMAQHATKGSWLEQQSPAHWLVYFEKFWNISGKHTGKYTVAHGIT